MTESWGRWVFAFIASICGIFLGCGICGIYAGERGAWPTAIIGAVAYGVIFLKALHDDDL